MVPVLLRLSWRLNSYEWAFRVFYALFDKWDPHYLRCFFTVELMMEISDGARPHSHLHLILRPVPSVESWLRTF